MAFAYPGAESAFIHLDESLSDFDTNMPIPGDYTPSPTSSTSRVERSARECLPFRRPPIDRYLFRVFDSHSDGMTDLSFARSRDACQGDASATIDIFEEIDPESIAAMAFRHLADVRNLDARDNLVSWTSSTLYALQYALHRSITHEVSLDKVWLCVVDTTALPHGVFVKDLDLYHAFSSYDHNLEKLRIVRTTKLSGIAGPQYFGEYLSQGTLQIEGCCGIVSVQQLVDVGLFQLQPDFERDIVHIHAPTVADEVLRLRQTGHRPELRDADVRTAMKCGNLFGDRWRLPMAVSSLSLQAWTDMEGPITRVIGANIFTDYELADFSRFSTRIVALPTMPELTRFAAVQAIINSDLRTAAKDSTVRGQRSEAQCWY